MSARDAESGSSTYRPGSKQPPRRAGGGGIADLLASLFGRGQQLQPGTVTFNPPPAPPPRPTPAPLRPETGGVPLPIPGGTPTPTAAPFVPRPTLRPPQIPPQTPGGYPQMLSPNLGPLPPPAYNPTVRPYQGGDMHYPGNMREGMAQRGGGAPYRQNDDLAFDPATGRMIRLSEQRDQGMSLAGPGGWETTDYYAPTVGMGPMPYDPRYAPNFNSKPPGGLR